MKIHRKLTAVASLFALITSCKEKPSESASTKNASEAGAINAVDATVGIKPKAIPVEIRADKLGYMPGDQFPYTGEAVELFPDSPSRVMRHVTYAKGLRQGRELTFYKNGVIKIEKLWDNGVAKSEKFFYKDGQLKTEMGCAPEGTPMGPHKIYHPNGQLMVVNTLSRDSRPTGNEKRYNSEGKLIGEYLYDNGLLKEIVSETEEGKAIREQQEADALKKAQEADTVK
jgi:hypothetical protein